jgi:hypothetical protein
MWQVPSLLWAKLGWIGFFVCTRFYVISTCSWIFLLLLSTVSVWPWYGCQCKPCLLIDTCSSSSLKYPKKKVPEAKSRTSQTLEGVPSKSEKIEKTSNNNTCVRLAVTVHWADSLHHHQPWCFVRLVVLCEAVAAWLVVAFAKRCFTVAVVLAAACHSLTRRLRRTSIQAY